MVRLGESVMGRLRFVVLLVLAGFVAQSESATRAPAGRASRAGWQPVSTLFSASPADFPMAVNGPTVALDGHGRATAVWLYSSAPRGEQVVMEADWTAARGWTPARTLTAFGVDVFRPPSLAVDGRGDAVIAWTADDRVFASYRLAGRAWQPPRMLSGVGESGDHPLVGIDNRGQALVMWSGPGGSQVVVRGRTGAWGPPKSICRCGPTVALAMNPRGQALVVWAPYEAGAYDGLWERARSPSGRWSPRHQIASVGTGREYLSLAMNARGAAVVAWGAEAPNPPYEQLDVAIRPSRGHFGRPQTVGGDAYWGFVVSIAPTGEATLLWADYSCCLNAMSRRPGARSFRSKQVFDPGTIWKTEPGAVAMDARGNTLALWTRLGDTNSHLYIRAAQRPAGGSLDHGSDIGDIGEDSYKHSSCSGEPSLAMSANGRLAIGVWLARSSSALLCSTVEAATFTR